jgi:Flp pilus assembly protein TadG
MVMVRKLRNAKCCGVVLVEFALVLPLLLMLVLGALRYGHLFLKAQQITNAARHGARIAILPNATDNMVRLEVASLMDAAGMTQAQSGYTVGITPSITPGVGNPVTVQIRIPSVANIAVIQVPLFTNIEPNGGAWPIGAMVTMAKEGF